MQHAWLGLPLQPSDSLTISLIHISRLGSTNWPQLSVQFALIRTDLNVSYEASGTSLYESWLYGATGNDG